MGFINTKLLLFGIITIIFNIDCGSCNKPTDISDCENCNDNNYTQQKSDCTYKFNACKSPTNISDCNLCWSWQHKQTCIALATCNNPRSTDDCNLCNNDTEKGHCLNRAQCNYPKNYDHCNQCNSDSKTGTYDQCTNIVNSINKCDHPNSTTDCNECNGDHTSTTHEKCMNRARCNHPLRDDDCNSCGVGSDPEHLTYAGCMSKSPDHSNGPWSSRGAIGFCYTNGKKGGCSYNDCSKWGMNWNTCPAGYVVDWHCGTCCSINGACAETE